MKKGTTPPSYSDAWYNNIIDFIELARLVTNYKKTYLIKDVREWIKQSDNNETSITTSNKKRRTSIVEI